MRWRSTSERGSGPWGVLQATKASLKGRGGLGGAHRVLEQEETRRRRVSGDGVGELGEHRPDPLSLLGKLS